MSIRARIIFAVFILLGLMGSQVVITISLVTRIAGISEQIVGYSLNQLDQINSIGIDLMRLRTSELFLLSGAVQISPDYSSSSGAGLVQDLQRHSLSFSEGLDTGEKDEFKSFLINLQVFLDQHRLLFNQASLNQKELASRIFADSQPVFEQLYRAVEDFRQRYLAAANKSADRGSIMAAQAKSLLTTALLMAAVVEFIMFWYLTRYINRGLRILMEATRRVTEGELRQPVIVDTQDEFAHLARSFNAMMRSLAYAQEENSRLHEEALQMREGRIKFLREHLSKVVKAQEDERKRVARELHDQAGQALIAIQLGLGRIEKHADSSLGEELESLRSLTSNTMDDIRNLALDLRPSILDELGLLPAVRQCVKDFSRRTGIRIDLSMSPISNRLPSDLETTLFRVIQEGLTNIAKHSGADRGAISIAVSDKDIDIEVRDNGKGFDVPAAMLNEGKRSLGLFGMEERIALLGGHFKIQSAPGQGTVLTMEIPILSYASSTTA